LISPLSGDDHAWRSIRVAGVRVAVTVDDVFVTVGKILVWGLLVVGCLVLVGMGVFFGWPGWTRRTSGAV
jgi:hypothetical protein